MPELMIDFITSLDGYGAAPELRGVVERCQVARESVKHRSGGHLGVDDLPPRLLRRHDAGWVWLMKRTAYS